MGSADGDHTGPEGEVLPSLRPLPDRPVSEHTIDFESWDVVGKPWDQMDRREKLKTYDALTAAFNELAEKLRLDFDEILSQGKCTMRCTVKILLDVDPNDDPRLP